MEVMELLYLPFKVVKVLVALSLWFTFAAIFWAGWQQAEERAADRQKVQAWVCGDKATSCPEAETELDRRAEERAWRRREAVLGR
jgi:hypothetical protein